MILQDVFVYFVDEEDMSVDQISDGYCWFKASYMKYVTVQPRVFLIYRFFLWASTGAPLLVCLLTPKERPLFIRISAPPMQANKKSTPVFVRAGDAVSKQRKMGRMPTVRAGRGL